MARVLGTILERAGLTLLVLCAATFLYALAYPRWAEWQHEQQQPAAADLPAELDARDALMAVGGESPAAHWLAAPPTVPAAAVAEPDSGSATTGEPEAWSGAPTEELASADADAADDAALTAPVSYGRAERMQIPRIRLNSSVLEVGIANGEYQVPGWDVGHHADSPNPGAPGNSVFNGHLETINAGRVFARLKELKVGDAVYVYTGSHRLDWVVKAVRTVPDTDYSFVLPTSDTRLTLYTCAGRYNPLTRGYTHWLVVVGELVEATPLAS